MRSKLSTALVAVALWANAQVVATSGFALFAHHSHELHVSMGGRLLLHHDGEHHEVAGIHASGHHEGTASTASHEHGRHTDHVVTSPQPARSLTSHGLESDLGAVQTAWLPHVLPDPRIATSWSLPPPQPSQLQVTRTAILRL